MTNSATEVSSPVELARGNLGGIYVLRGCPIAFKEVHHNTPDANNALLQEYYTLNTIFDTCNADSLIFAIPRPIAFHNPGPEGKEYLSRAKQLGISILHPPPGAHSQPIVSEGTMKTFSRATYAMDRVHALPPDVSKFVMLTYPDVSGFPASQEERRPPRLCRLYFGKEYATNPAPAMPPSAGTRRRSNEDFPLDGARYTTLHAAFSEFSIPEKEVARGMGRILARMHFGAGVDARGVEFVLGSHGDSRLSYFVIDFDKVRQWDKSFDVAQLVSAFFENDPYYPRPVKEDARGLYTAFRTGYLSACSEEDRELGQAFLEAIEEEEIRVATRRHGSLGLSLGLHNFF